MGTHPIFESDFDCLTENQNLVSFHRQDAGGNIGGLNSRLSSRPVGPTTGQPSESQEQAVPRVSSKSSTDDKIFRKLKFNRKLKKKKKKRLKEPVVVNTGREMENMEVDSKAEDEQISEENGSESILESTGHDISEKTLRHTVTNINQL